MKEFFAIVAVLCVVIGHVPYIVGILKRRVHPHPYSWLIWTIVMAVVSLGQWSKGAEFGALPTAMATCFAGSIFLLSLTRSFEHVHASDRWFLLAALLGIVPWLFTKDATLSVVFMEGVNVIGFLPTMRKVRIAPKSEHPLLYEMNLLRHTFALISLGAYNLATTIDPLLMFVMNAWMIFLIFKGEWGRSPRRRKGRATT